MNSTQSSRTKWDAGGDPRYLPTHYAALTHVFHSIWNLDEGARSDSAKSGQLEDEIASYGYTQYTRSLAKALNLVKSV